MITWRLQFLDRGPIGEGSAYPSFLDVPPGGKTIVAIGGGKVIAGVHTNAEYPIPVFYRRMRITLDQVAKPECECAIIGRANKDGGEFWRVDESGACVPAPAEDLDAVMIGLQTGR